MPKYVEIKLTKCTLFLTEHELQNLLYLLSMNPVLRQEAIRRGKFILRQRKEIARREKAAMPAGGR